MRTNIALVGGGTAGHVMPNFALLPHLQRKFDNVIYVGSKNSMEEKLCAEKGLDFYPTETMKFYRKKIWKNAALPLALFRGIKEAKTILKERDISLVFSTGGYAAVPTVLAARSLKIPVVCHESDKSMGLANRLTAKIAARVYTAFPDTYKSAIVLSTPVREEIFNGERVDLFLRKDRKTLLFMGGSLGAEAINDALSQAFATLSNKYNILHISGGGKSPLKTPSYYAIPFTNRVEDLFATADLVVSRAGASTLGELTALGKRVVAVPLPKGESRGDQEENAAYYLSIGAIGVLPQECLSAERLFEVIEESMRKRPPAPTYDRDTPRKLAEELYRIAIERK